MMRTGLLLVAVASASAGPPGSTFGTWKMDATRSTFVSGAKPRSLSLRIEPHAKGEVFTLDKVESDGRATSSSSILYLNGTPRDSQGFDCAVGQSWRRVDSRTVELRRKCADSDVTWFVRQSMEQPNELIIGITEKRLDGSHLEWRLVLNKQPVEKH